MGRPDDVAERLQQCLAPEATRQVMARFGGAIGKEPRMLDNSLTGRKKAGVIMTVAAQHIRNCCSRKE